MWAISQLIGLKPIKSNSSNGKHPSLCFNWTYPPPPGGGRIRSANAVDSAYCGHHRRLQTCSEMLASRKECKWTAHFLDTASDVSRRNHLLGDPRDRYGSATERHGTQNRKYVKTKSNGPSCKWNLISWHSHSWLLSETNRKLCRGGQALQYEKGATPQTLESQKKRKNYESLCSESVFYRHKRCPRKELLE